MALAEDNARTIRGFDRDKLPFLGKFRENYGTFSFGKLSARVSVGIRAINQPDSEVVKEILIDYLLRFDKSSFKRLRY
ncbi:hypothetical protein CEXT_495191 [Caerostris extrusa]|uniref:Uncharacterized protein n=1 Tax=Caerostris extrusa TaxID=172846 RepID=A0AAV4WTQ5_CAEEX|nr:hypothetical protein CEXT_495191 [Caerostris extrusa]